MEVIHVAGTNGKGSVCAFSEQILRDAGIKTGLFTSPHLITYRERIRVNGEVIEEAKVAEILSELRDLVSDWETHPTFFELSLILAMKHFAEQRCEVVLLETGMGGRLDSTNAVQSSVSVITPIGLDHQQWLGETIREIAGEKAGILKPTVPVVVADLHPEARDVVGRKALILSIPYIEAHPLPLEWELGLAGPHQRENAALAVEATCRIAGESLTQEGIQKSLAATQWPGRFQRVGDQIIIDGAHNEAAAKALCETWQEVFSDEKARLVFGAAESKAVVEIFRELLPIVGSVTFVPIKSERRLSTKEMQKALQEAGGNDIPVDETSSLEGALHAAEHSSSKTLVAGSLFLVGEALGLLDGVSFEVSLQ
ncbi:MAG: folylpolyglutamate synthase/dihydrofolate synthase family protein [Verrucomicrobiota bacterium]